MMHPNVVIHPFLELDASPALIAGLDGVFFEASNTKAFSSDAARAAFRDLWLGRYLAHDPAWAYVATAPDGRVAGYLAGSLDDPAVTPRFADIAYFAAFKDLTRRYPAHLHVNLAAEFRGHGVGARLIGRFVDDARVAGAPGVHVVTSRGARNVTFYTRNGFSEAGVAGEGAREVVFFCRKL